MSGQVKMLPAPPRRQCRTRVGKIPQPKREKPSTSSVPKMVARKIPQPPLRRLPPSRRLRPSALKRGPRSSDSVQSGPDGGRSAEDGRLGSMKPERGDGGVTRGMMGKNLVAQGTQFDPEGSPHAPAEATEAANRRMAVTPMHGYEPDVLIFSLVQK